MKLLMFHLQLGDITADPVVLHQCQYDTDDDRTEKECQQCPEYGAAALGVRVIANAAA